MTPRPYLSWSQMNTLENSERRYVGIYLGNETVPINRGMAFGRTVAESLDEDKPTEDPVLDLVLARIPNIGPTEFAIGDPHGTDPVMLNGVPLFMRLDRFNMRTKRQAHEYKTGIGKWTQKMVDESGQITFYFSGIFAKYGIRPEDIDFSLFYIPTRYDGQGRIECVGDIVEFKTKRTMVDIMAMSARQKKAWKRIQELSIEHLS